MQRVRVHVLASLVKFHIPNENNAQLSQPPLAIRFPSIKSLLVVIVSQQSCVCAGHIGFTLLDWLDLLDLLDVDDAGEDV
jgi:hypothetical protein